MKDNKKIIIKEIKSEKKWDNFVKDSYNGTIFHEMRFLSYHPKDKFDIKYLGIYEGDHNLLAVLSCEIKDGILKSPVGASYGGLVLPDSTFGLAYWIVEGLLNWARNHKIREIKFTHAPLVYNHRLAQDLDYILLYCGFDNDYNQFSSVLDLYWFQEEDPLVKFSPAGRRAVKKSFAEGVEIEISNDLEGYYPILVKNKRKFGVEPAHSLDDLMKLRQLYPDAFKLFLVKFQGKAIGGIYTFHCNERVLLTFYIASLPEYQHVRPINRALYEIVLWATKKGYKYLDLGISMNTAANNPMEPAWSLISFKEHIGTRGFLRPSYRWPGR